MFIEIKIIYIDESIIIRSFLPLTFNGNYSVLVVSHVVNVFASALKSGQICKTIVLLYSSSVIRTKFIDYFSDELHNTPTPR